MHEYVKLREDDILMVRVKGFYKYTGKVSEGFDRR